VELVTGKGGVFYIENLEPGTYPLQLTSPAGSCKVNLAIVRSAEAVVDLGSLACEPNR
jgi:outer membrane usher protein